MSENYTGQSETEHLIRQAAHELQISPITIEGSLEHAATYSVKFKDKRGNDQEIFVPMAAQFGSIVAAMKAAKKAKPE